jgi:hypothetical protein
MFDPSLSDLVIFAPSEPVVNEYIADTKSTWSKGKYWLGGQIMVDPNEKITEALINRVQQLFDNSDNYACNSAEMTSIMCCKRQFEEIKNVLLKYHGSMKVKSA